MARKVRTVVGVVAGVIGVVGAVAYRLRSEISRGTSLRQKRVDQIIRECAGEEIGIFAD